MEVHHRWVRQRAARQERGLVQLERADRADAVGVLDQGGAVGDEERIDDRVRADLW